MSLVGSRWSDTLFGSLTGKGFVGIAERRFTDAVGLGSVAHVVGKPFATTDVGLVPSAGPAPGAGVGVVGFSQSLVSDDVFNESVSRFGTQGIRLRDVCDSIGETCVAEMNQATLTSVHTPVFAGTGTIVPGSIGVVGPDWGTSIFGVGVGLQFQGIRWNDWSQAIGIGQAMNVQNFGTGSVVISGSPSGIPVPGAGAGTGTIS